MWGQFLWEQLSPAPAPAQQKVEIQPAITNTPGNKRARSPTMTTANSGRSDGSQHFPTKAGLSKNTWTVENAWHIAGKVINTLKIFMAFNYTGLTKATTQP